MTNEKLRLRPNTKITLTVPLADKYPAGHDYSIVVHTNYGLENWKCAQYRRTRRHRFLQCTSWILVGGGARISYGGPGPPGPPAGAGAVKADSHPLNLILAIMRFTIAYFPWTNYVILSLNLTTLPLGLMTYITKR